MNPHHAVRHCPHLSWRRLRDHDPLAAGTNHRPAEGTSREQVILSILLKSPQPFGVPVATPHGLDSLPGFGSVIHVHAVVIVRKMGPPLLWRLLHDKIFG